MVEVCGCHRQVCAALTKLTMHLGFSIDVLKFGTCWATRLECDGATGFPCREFLLFIEEKGWSHAGCLWGVLGPASHSWWGLALPGCLRSRARLDHGLVPSVAGVLHQSLVAAAQDPDPGLWVPVSLLCPSSTSLLPCLPPTAL